MQLQYKWYPIYRTLQLKNTHWFPGLHPSNLIQWIFLSLSLLFRWQLVRKSFRAFLLTYDFLDFILHLNIIHNCLVVLGGLYRVIHGAVVMDAKNTTRLKRLSLCDQSRHHSLFGEDHFHCLAPWRQDWFKFVQSPSGRWPPMAEAPNFHLAIWVFMFMFMYAACFFPYALYFVAYCSSFMET